RDQQVEGEATEPLRQGVEIAGDSAVCTNDVEIRGVREHQELLGANFTELLVDGRCVSAWFNQGVDRGVDQDADRALCVHDLTLDSELRALVVPELDAALE